MVAVALQAIALGYLASLLPCIVQSNHWKTSARYRSTTMELHSTNSIIPNRFKNNRWGLGTEKTSDNNKLRSPEGFRCFNTNHPRGSSRWQEIQIPFAPKRDQRMLRKKAFCAVSLESRRYPSAVSSTRSLAARWLAFILWHTHRANSRSFKRSIALSTLLVSPSPTSNRSPSIR